MKKRKRYVLFYLIFIAVLSSVFTSNAQDSEENTTVEKTSERKEKAAQLGLADWVDEEGYLIDSFFDGKSDQTLTDMGLDGLVRTLTEEELDAYVEALNMGIGLYTVTRYEKVSQVNPATGGTLYTGVFEVDGRLAYCIERSVSTPPKGSSTGSWIEVTNDNLRKVLYYGYNGPAAKGYTYVETALAAGEANGDGDNSLGRKVLAEIKVYASPPSGFKVWKVETNGGSTQDLAFYTLEEKGNIQVKKVSGNTEVTNGNTNYSLEGAKYGIYSDSACSAKVGEVTTDSTGVSGKISLNAGTYYVKEIAAPKGYQLSSEVKSVNVVSAVTTILTMTDMPKVLKPEILIQKKDAETGESKPQGLESFKGTQFSVKFYGGEYGEGVNPEQNGALPDRQWILETDEAGVIRLNDEYFISGDDFWTNASNEQIFPLGTITIQEIKPPDGYLINPEIFVRKMGIASEKIETVTVSETRIEICLIIKKTNEDGKPLAGAEFTVYSDKECTKEVMKDMTDENGIIMFSDLLIQTMYYIRESKAPVGYASTQEVYEIYPENLSENTELYLDVINEKMFRLPETGGSGIWLYALIGSGCSFIELVEKNRRK